MTPSTSPPGVLVAGRLVALVAVVVGLALATAPVPVAAEAGPGYPPSPGDDQVVDAGHAPADAPGEGPGDGPVATDGASDTDGPGDGPVATDGGSDTDVGEPAQAERPADEVADDEARDAEAAARGAATEGGPAPSEGDGRSMGPLLLIVAAAAVLGGAVVGIARRI